ncbi:hypothetical protein PAXINDRAFT_127167 [Paxillus involutus ATCC 200175]|jgi:hypothetical protein|nr:hypothetical protein PAXINDRAFT_127167 [Paxillus involutus ATCC 200175]
MGARIGVEIEIGNGTEGEGKAQSWRVSSTSNDELYHLSEKTMAKERSRLVYGWLASQTSWSPD